MRLKLKTMAVTLAACGLALGFSSAQAQKLSGDKIVIGFITDMSSLYSDLDGPAGVEVDPHGDRRHAEGVPGQEDRGRLRGPPEQGRHLLVARCASGSTRAAPT